MIRNALHRFMYGRYGVDQLNMALLVIYLLTQAFFMMTGFDLFYYLSVATLVYLMFRILSRNIPRRQAENGKFLRTIGPVTNWFRLRRTIHRDKDHCYFKCPNCGQNLRVPKGKGRITVTCRSRGASFQEKS